MGLEVPVQVTEQPRPTLNVEGARKARNWRRSELLGRALWSLAWPLFRLTPRPFFWGWRAFLLRCFGARIGVRVHISPTVRIAIPWNLEVGDYSALGDGVWVYNLGRLTIGSQVTISQRAHLCGGSHDYESPIRELQKLPITIGNMAWICAEAYVGPGVTVGEGAVVGARAVAVKDVEPWAVVAGNPCRVVKTRHLRSESPAPDDKA